MDIIYFIPSWVGAVLKIFKISVVGHVTPLEGKRAAKAELQLGTLQRRLMVARCWQAV